MSRNIYRNNLSSYDDLFASGIEFTAMMTTLHSTLDILAQWLNVKYNLKHNESKVTFKQVKNRITDVKLKNKLNKLLEDCLYIDDFCNYIKHRNIVKVSRVFYFVSPTQPAVFHDIEPFKRNGRMHNSKRLISERKKQFTIMFSSIKDITGINIILADLNNKS